LLRIAEDRALVQIGSAVDAGQQEPTRRRSTPRERLNY
jgi:hypothetical protein